SPTTSEMVLDLQQRYEREYGSICQLDRENSEEYMERFTRLASFVGVAAGDAQRQARHFKWGLKKVSMCIGVVRTRVLSIGVVRIEVMIRNDRIFRVSIRGLLVGMGMTARVK
nr:zinc finger, CCHC-type, retrotransposon Gag domain protein [Tanacetum cinerariifolium]